MASDIMDYYEAIGGGGGIMGQEFDDVRMCFDDPRTQKTVVFYILCIRTIARVF